MLGTNCPPLKTALPMPVPNVSRMTVPVRPRPAPNHSSAMPAASASLTSVTGAPSRSASFRAAFTPIHALSTLAAVRAVPSTTTPG